MAKQSHTATEQRSNVKNPNNPQYTADRSNRIEQGHPNVPPPAPQEPQPSSTAPKK